MSKSEGGWQSKMQYTHYKGYPFTTITNKGPSTKFQVT
jgi:hypothetical protein